MFVPRNGELSLKRNHLPTTITKGSLTVVLAFFLLAGETVGQRFIMNPWRSRAIQ